MVNVNVNFNGRDYLLACEEGQEEDLQKLTEELSKKFKISRERIRQIETKAFEKLQKSMINAKNSKNLLPKN